MFQSIKPSFLIFSIVFWTLTSNLYVFIRFAGDLSDQGQPILTASLIFQVTITGIVIGVILSFLQNVRVVHTKVKRSFTKTIILNTLKYLIFFSIVICASSLYGNSLEFAKEFILSTESLVTLSFLALNSMIFHFIIQMNRMFGPGVLLEYTTGKYFNPVEEERIFMFLDLKSSTGIAEKLGHAVYSKLVQDCFALVAGPAAQFKARIYQYVGDEAVITWRFSKSSVKEYCLHFFFEFQDLLVERKQYFTEHYGIIPEFKAGLHYGKVMAAEVGKWKSEIAYHGDVLNAASRIQGMCNEFGESLLISEKLLDQLEITDKYKSKYLGNLELKGKNEKIKVHSIKRSY